MAIQIHREWTRISEEEAALRAKENLSPNGDAPD